LNISPCCKKNTPEKEKNQNNGTKNDIQLERMLYNILNDIDDLEEHKLSIKDIKNDIKKILNYIKNDV
jgi:hypothetical protein